VPTSGPIHQGIYVVAVDGELDTLTAPALKTCVSEQVLVFDDVEGRHAELVSGSPAWRGMDCQERLCREVAQRHGLVISPIVCLWITPRSLGESEIELINMQKAEFPIVTRCE
jgi:hypothetical protein